jgi:hypothetical protein
VFAVVPWRSICALFVYLMLFFHSSYLSSIAQVVVFTFVCGFDNLDIP